MCTKQKSTHPQLQLILWRCSRSTPIHLLVTIEPMLNDVQARMMDYGLTLQSARAMIGGKTPDSSPFQLLKLAEQLCCMTQHDRTVKCLRLPAL